MPDLVLSARADREFLGRAVRYLAGTAGIRQFLDIGTGLPTADNTHQVAQSVAPESRIVYVDNDPLVLAHARALLSSSPEGSCDYLDADIRNPDGILETAAGLLDFTQPVALMLMGIMGHFTDDEAYPIVSRLQAGLPPGSYFALYDGASTNEALNQAQQGYKDSGAVPYHLRRPERQTCSNESVRAGRLDRGDRGADQAGRGRLVSRLAGRIGPADQPARRERDLHPAEPGAAAEQLLVLLGPQRRGPG